MVKAHEESNVDNVGTVCIAEPFVKTQKATAIAKILSSPFGVGNSYFRTGVDRAREVDTVPFGAYKKEVFNRIGSYDERLRRNQDIELNKRLIKHGGRIVLLPDSYCIYYPRTEYLPFMKNSFQNGLWVILTAYFTNALGSLSLRHFVPLFFLFYILLLPLLCSASLLLILPLLLYFILAIWSAFKISFREKSCLLWAYVLPGFFMLHLSYGYGSLCGVFKVLSKRFFSKNG